MTNDFLHGVLGLVLVLLIVIFMVANEMGWLVQRRTLDKEWGVPPFKEGWAFAFGPRQVEGQEICFRWYYYKQWVDWHLYDGANCIYNKFYLTKPGEVNE